MKVEHLVFIVAIAALVLLCGCFIVLGLGDNGRIDSYRQHCAEAGGHIYEPDRIAFCLKDGLWVEVYP